MNITRRNLIRLAASAGVLSRGGRAAETKEGLIVNSTRPRDYEMTLAGFRDWITPDAHFFARSHHYTPDVKLSDWSLKVEGVVSNSQTWALADLKKLQHLTHVAVLECAGNGRSFYEPHIPGMQWKYGGVANARWTGVRLADVLKKAGVKDSAKEVLFDGEDVPVGKMP